MNTGRNNDTYFLRKRSQQKDESNDDSMFADQTYLSVDQRTDGGSVSFMESKQYWCQQWVYAHREGNVTEEKKYVAKKKCVVTNSSDSTASFESSLDLNNLKESKKQHTKKVKFNIDDIHAVYNCDWNECDYKSSHLNEYFNHISDHVDILWTEEWQSNREKWFTCSWKNCTFQSHCEVKSTTHVNFHAYHTRLKCIGVALLNLCEIPVCKLSNDGVNILPELPDEFECNWRNCGERFECMQYYVYHIAQHLEIEEFKGYNYICQWTDCASQFTIRHRLIDHLKSHTQQKSCACPNCGTMFATFAKLKDHCRQSDNDKSNQCSLCKKTFSCERLLKQHVRLHINYFKCHQCDSSFSRAAQLATHIRYRHIGVKPFKCHLCESKFVRKLDLTTHLKKHAPGPLFKCSKENCDFSCRSEYAIRKHIAMVHYDNAEGLYKYYCHLCGSLFLRGSFLTKHLKIKHNFNKPSGLKRFRYIEDDDGYYKLQTSRYECLDIQEQTKIKLINHKNVVIRKKSQTISNEKQLTEFIVDIQNTSDLEDEDEDVVDNDL